MRNKIPTRCRVSRTVLFYFSRHCEALAALKACCHAISKLNETEVEDVTRDMVDLVYGQLSESTPHRLQHGAAHLISTLTGTLRLPKLWLTAPIQKLLNASMGHLKNEVSEI